MTTYRERKDNQYNLVLTKDGEVLGTFGSLKKICDYMKKEDFPSYWTLVRKKEYPLIIDNYKVFKVKHY